ncbi:MAG: hypothetical protein D6798_19300 [Deltaproteobacteria bacterium]|nr:MAG: hypothetical protein D6798_19300 [Deltaproteobacteria bacterium]
MAGWAVQHATVDVSSSGVSGYQVWEIFDRRWDDRQNSRHHLCAVVQQVEGGLVADFEGCDGCEASYELEVDLLETDCPADTVDPSVFSGVRGYGFGEVPSELRDADPDPGRSVGWYVSWDGQQAEALGFATPEDDTVDATGWQVDTRYELVPAVAWEL